MYTEARWSPEFPKRTRFISPLGQLHSSHKQKVTGKYKLCQALERHLKMYSIFTLHVYTTRLLLRGKTRTLLLGACSLSLCALLRSIEIWVESRDSGVMPSFLVITSSLIPFSCFNCTVHVSTKWKSMSTFFGPLVFKKTCFCFFSCFDLVPQSLRLALLSSSWSHIKKHCIDSKACDFPSFGMHKAHNLFELKLERCQGRHLGSELSLCVVSLKRVPLEKQLLKAPMFEAHSLDKA